MKTLILILIVASFLQTTILPMDLVLLILICRAYIRSGSENLYLAFAFGLLNAHLNLTSLGLTSLIYLLAVTFTEGLSKLRLAGHPLLIVPLSLSMLSVNQIVSVYLAGGQAWQLSKVIMPAVLSLPIFYLVKIWEERFVVKKEIKLRF